MVSNDPQEEWEMTPTNELRWVEREIEVKLIREMLEYRDGNLYWKVRPVGHFVSKNAMSAWNGRWVGTQAGATDSNGYKVLAISIGGVTKYHRVHRIVWAVVNGVWPSGQIDHINQDRSDSRIENLRDVAQSINQRNAKRSKRNTSGVTGVSWNKSSGKWIAHCRLQGKQVCLGTFVSIDDAATAVKAFRSANGYSEIHGRDVPLVKEEA